MKFHLEATPAELWQKGTALIEELVKAFSVAHPSLSEALEKALPQKEQSLKYPMLQGLKDITTKEYDATLKRMLADIGKVLDQSISGATGSVGLEKSGKLSKQEDEEEEKLEPGDVDPETGDLIPEEEEEEEEEGEGEEEDKSLEKNLPQSDPLDHDFTEPIAAKDALAYARIKRVLIEGHGYVESDFEEKGQFYGRSVNELIDFARAKRKAP